MRTKMKPLATKDTAMNFLLVEGKLHRVVSIRDLGASCFGLRFPVLRFRNYHLHRA